MNVLERIEQAKKEMDAQAAAVIAKAEARLAATNSAPAPVSKSMALSGLTEAEMRARVRAGTLSLNDYNDQMDLRRRNPKAHQLVKESTEHANDQVTAARLAALVKGKYMTERTKEKKELIIKTALDASIERMSQADFDLMQANLSKAERRELEFQRTNESQFQENLLGSPEAVAEYWLAFLARPKLDPQAIAKADLVELAKSGDEVALELTEYFKEQQALKRAKANAKRTYNLAVRVAG